MPSETALGPAADAALAEPRSRERSAQPEILNVPRRIHGERTIPVEVRILGPVEEFDVHWVDGRKRTRPCWGNEHCPHCKIDGHDTRRVGYAAAEAYGTDRQGRRVARLVVLAVPKKSLPAAKAIPVGRCVTVCRRGSGRTDRLSFEPVDRADDPGAVHPGFDARSFMLLFWFQKGIPFGFNAAPPANPAEALPAPAWTPSIPFAESEDEARDFLFRHFGANTLTGIADVIRRHEKPAPAENSSERMPDEHAVIRQSLMPHYGDSYIRVIEKNMALNKALGRCNLPPVSPLQEAAWIADDYARYEALLRSHGERAAAEHLAEVRRSRFPESARIESPDQPPPRDPPVLQTAAHPVAAAFTLTEPAEPFPNEPPPKPGGKPLAARRLGAVLRAFRPSR